MSTLAANKRHVCSVCNEGFGSRSAQKQHRQAQHGQTGPASHYQSRSILHGGILYSAPLSPGEEQAVVRQLPDLCHSIERLQKERYTFEPSSGSFSRGGSGHGRDPTSTAEKTTAAASLLAAPKLAAVVLDCEMAGTADDESPDELIKLTIIDFFSGRVLCNALVYPTRPITDWRTAITGIDAALMQAAVVDFGQMVLGGWEAARAELWRWADKDTTVFVGHSLQKDLKVLHIAGHDRIIDTAIMTADAVLGKNRSRIGRRWGLQVLCREILGVEIRQAGGPRLQEQQQDHHRGGEVAHDSLEDTLATRELALLCILYPNQLEMWARGAKQEFFRKKKKVDKGAPRPVQG